MAALWIKVAISMRSAAIPIERLAALGVFVLFVVPLVVLCAWRVPTGLVPDEPTQVARVASVLNGQIIGHRVTTMNRASGGQDAGVTANFGLVVAAFAGTGKAAPAPFNTSPTKRLEWVRSILWSPGPIFVSSVNTAAYAPVAYIPAALGMGVAILGGALPHAAIIGARLGNALAFSLLGIAALMLARRGRLLILVTLALPMTIWLAGSANQDGVVIAVAVLGVALLTRAGPTAFWCGCAALAAVALQKPPYLPLAVLPLIAPQGLSWRALQERLPGGIAVAVPGLLWSMAVVTFVAVPLLPSPLYHPGPLWPGNHADLFHSANAAAQLQGLLHHPIRAALLPVRTLVGQFQELWHQFIGVLGILTIPLPHRLYTLWWLALLSALGPLAARPNIGEDGITRLPVTRLLVVAAMLCSAELIFLTLYLTWTPVGMDRIDGVQGRYFIPMLPVVVFVVPAIAVCARLPRWVWWIIPIATILATDATLPRLIAACYQS